MFKNNNNRVRRSLMAMILILMMIGGMASGVSARPINEGTAMEGEHPIRIFIRWDPHYESPAERLKETLKKDIPENFPRSMEPEDYHRYPEWLVKAYSSNAEADPNRRIDEIAEMETEEIITLEIEEEISEGMLQFMKLSLPLQLSSRELNFILEDTSFEGLGSFFMEGARENEINELYLITQAMREAKASNPENTKGIVVEKVANSPVEPREVFNIFGIGAVENDPLKSAYEYGYEQEWFSLEKAIVGGAAWLAEHKIHRDENPQNTFFKELWDGFEESGYSKTDTGELEGELMELKKTQQWQRETIQEFYEALNLYTYYFEIPENTLEEIAGDERIVTWPVPDRKIVSSGFGLRKDPFEDELRFHQGIDIPGKLEDPIVAVKSGVVTISRKGGSYGNWIEIDHGQGWTTRYAHNHENLVTVGEEVEKGRTIALLGSSGRSTGPHLHFEVRREGKPVDPMYWFEDQGH